MLILLIPPVVLLVVAMFKPRSFWTVLALASPLFLQEASLGEMIGSDSGTMLQKAWIGFTILCLGTRVGWRNAPWPVWILLCLYVVHAALTLLGPSPHASLTGSDSFTGIVLSGTAGLGYVWVVAFVDWRNVSARELALGLSIVPVACLVYSLLPQVLGVSTMFITEWTGVTRLSGGLASAYFGALAAFGTVGAAWLWLLGSRAGGYLLLLNAGLTAASGTRGALFLAACVAAFATFSALRGRVRISPPLALAVGVVGVVGLAVLLPNLIERTFASSDGQAINASGRAVAWPYFLRVYEQSPWVGHGAGWASVVHQHTEDPTIRLYYKAPHNTFLQLMIDFGAPVMVIVVALLVAAFVMFIARARVGPLAWGLAIGLPLYMYVDNVLTVSQPAVMLVLALSCLWAQSGADKPFVADPVPAVSSGLERGGRQQVGRVRSSVRAPTV